MVSYVYIGLGSNLNKPVQQIQSALQALRPLAEGSAITVSPLYLTEPLGPADQPDYVNAVAGFETSLSPLDLLDALQRIETEHDRQRNDERWGPRTLDLDILLYGEKIIDNDRLQVPHPQMHERAFVLQPLADIAAEINIPGHGQVQDVLLTLDRSGIRQQVDHV